MESLQDWGLMGEIYIGCGFIRGKLAGIYYDILGRVGGRLAAGRGLLDIKICMPTRQGIVCGRLKASRSLLQRHELYAYPAGAYFCSCKSRQNTLGAVPQDPLTLKLRRDTNDALASSVQRRRYALKVPAAHFYVKIVDRVPLPRSGGGGRGRGQMRPRLPLERICAQYGFVFPDY